MLGNCGLVASRQAASACPTRPQNDGYKIAPDMMIRDSGRRCVAALLRLANGQFGTQDGETSALLGQNELAAVVDLSRSRRRACLGSSISVGCAG